jgi:hypothetical protein
MDTPRIESYFIEVDGGSAVFQTAFKNASGDTTPAIGRKVSCLNGGTVGRLSNVYTTDVLDIIPGSGDRDSLDTGLSFNTKTIKALDKITVSDTGNLQYQAASQSIP